MSNVIQLVTYGREVGIQIGQHNIYYLNIDVSNDLQTKDEAGITNEDGDLVKMTLNMHPASSSTICVASLEERILQSLSGDEREEINRVLLEKFGVKIVDCMKGSIVLLLRKMKPLPDCLVIKKVQLEFLSTLFTLYGLSYVYLSEINLRVQLTPVEDIFDESQLKKTGLDLTYN